MPAIKFKTEDSEDFDLLTEDGSPLGEATFAPSNEVRKQFSKFVDRSKKEGKKTLVTEHNRPAAALIPVAQYRILKMLDKAGYTEKLSELTYQELEVGTNFKKALKHIFEDFDDEDTNEIKVK